MGDGDEAAASPVVPAVGRGPLQHFQLTRLGDAISVRASERTLWAGALGQAADKLARLSVIRLPVWPMWWLGWGPAWVCDLVLCDSQGAALVTVPAGGGLLETARVAQRGGVLRRTESVTRLIPGWSEQDLRKVVGELPIEQSEVPRRDRGVVWLGPGALSRPEVLVAEIVASRRLHRAN